MESEWSMLRLNLRLRAVVGASAHPLETYRRMRLSSGRTVQVWRRDSLPSEGAQTRRLRFRLRPARDSRHSLQRYRIQSFHPLLARAPTIRSTLTRLERSGFGARTSTGSLAMGLPLSVISRWRIQTSQMSRKLWREQRTRWRSSSMVVFGRGAQTGRG